MADNAYQDIKKSLRQLYLEDNRPWLVGFSGGKDSTMLASMVFDVVLSLPLAERTRPISVDLADDLLNILKDGLVEQQEPVAKRA